MKHEFKIGKWYKIEKSSSYRRCLKMLDFDEMEYDELIRNKIYKKENGSIIHLHRLTEATLEEIQQYLPERHVDKITEVNEFKKGDYIVQLHKSGTKYLKQNYVFLQRGNSTNLDTNKDCTDYACCSSYVHFGNKNSWRYATQQESDHYDLIGKPYDVTTLDKVLIIEEALKVKEFVLPEKWCIKDNENKVIEKWFDENNQDGIDDYDIGDYGVHYLHYPMNDEFHSFDSIQNNYTEITFAQFKQYVLKEVTDAIPEYFECLSKNNYWTFGKIYKHIDKSEYPIKIGLIENSGEKTNVRDWNEKFLSKGNSCFKPSTKEAFEAQNEPKSKTNKMKKVEDLKYPDVVHCYSKDDTDLINKYLGKNGVYDYDTKRPYLLLDCSGWNNKPYEEPEYTNYDFSDIIFPEEQVKEPEFEFNKWYKSKYGLWFISSENTGYGIPFTGIHKDEWFVRKSSNGNWELKELTLVENFEVEQRLLNYAKEHYPIGTRFYVAHLERINEDSTYESKVLNESVFRINDGNVEFQGNSPKSWINMLFYKGKWAEIIPEPVKKPVEKHVEKPLSDFVKVDKFPWEEDLIPEPAISEVVKIIPEKTIKLKKVKVNLI